MSGNHPEEISRMQMQKELCDAGKGSASSALKSEQISNILNYRKPKFCSDFFNIDRRLKNDENGDLTKNGINRIDYGETNPIDEFPITNNCSQNNDNQVGTGEKYVLPTFSNDIESKPHLENIANEKEEIPRKDSVDESREYPISNDVVNTVSDVLAKNAAKSSDIENNQDASITSSNKVDQNIPKYPCSFLDDQKVQEEVFQQNLLAQQLLIKYFNKEERSDKSEKAKKIGSESTKKAMALLQNVSSILSRFTQIADKGEQVCIKPSDMYIYSNDENNQLPVDSTLQFIRPFRYHRNFSASTMNLNLDVPIESYTRRTRLCYESDTIHDSLADLRNRSFENVQFLNTKFTHSGHYNKILYKNDSRNLENNFSDEDFGGWNYPILSDRYLSLRNLYSYSYLGSNKSRYFFQTLPRASGLVGLKFDNGVDIKVSDEEYKLWLKQNDFVKYTDYSLTSNSSSSVPKTSTEEPTDISTSHTSAKLELVPYNRSSQERNNYDHPFGNINYGEIYQLILYEHIVISNCIHFFSCYFFAKRLKKLSICDRIIQLLFFIMCYYVMVFLNESGIKHLGDGINYKNVFK